MTTLTISQFVEQIQDENFDYALNAEIVTDAEIAGGEKVLCTGEAIYNFVYAAGDFDGAFTEIHVAECIEMMNQMS